jgi:hypothetical protein
LTSTGTGLGPVDFSSFISVGSGVASEFFLFGLGGQMTVPFNVVTGSTFI